MMKKTILTLMFALSTVGVTVFAESTEDSNAKAAAETKTTATSDSNAKTPEALGMDMSKHSTANVPQGGTPKVAASSVGVVKN
jgi:hypothetical protein